MMRWWWWHLQQPAVVSEVLKAYASKFMCCFYCHLPFILSRLEKLKMCTQETSAKKPASNRQKRRPNVEVQISILMPPEVNATLQQVIRLINVKTIKILSSKYWSK